MDAIATAEAHFQLAHSYTRVEVQGSLMFTWSSLAPRHHAAAVQHRPYSSSFNIPVSVRESSCTASGGRLQLIGSTSTAIRFQVLSDAAAKGKPVDELVVQQAGRAGINFFELPPVYTRFPMRLPPDYESVREECEAWGLSLMGPSASAAQRQAFLDGRYGLLGSVFYPLCCSRRRLVLLTKLSIFTFIFDDVMELTGAAAAAPLLRAAVAAWKSPTTSTGPRNRNRYTRAQSQMMALVGRLRTEVWDEICRDISSAVQSTLESFLLDWILKAGTDQSPNLFHNLSVDECIYYRCSVGGTDAFFKFVEYSLGIDVGDQLTSVPIMAKLRKHLLNHYFWVNDLLSFRKEFLQDGGQSYGRGTIAVLIAQAAAATLEVSSSNSNSRGDAELQAAINKLWAMIQEEEEIIARLKDEIKAQFPPSSDLVKLTEALCVTLATNMYWYTVSGRYGLHGVQFLHSEPSKCTSPTYILSLENDPSLQITLQTLPFNLSEEYAEDVKNPL